MDNFDLRKYLAEGRLFEEDDTTYALHITTVEYDNGKPGYTYEVVDLDTEEEVGSKFGFKPLYFVGSGDEGDQQVFKGQDFNSIKTYGMYQDKVVNKEESLYSIPAMLLFRDFNCSIENFPCWINDIISAFSDSGESSSSFILYL